MAGPVMRVFQTTTHAFNPLTQSAKGRRGLTALRGAWGT